MLFEIKLSENKAVPSKIQLMRTGEFTVGGAVVKITPTILQSFKKNFDSNVRGYPDKKLPIDYFHQNDQEAGGWIVNLELTDQGNTLMADVEWTPRATKTLSEGEIRYVSAEFSLDYQANEGGQKLGPTLLGAGLTNRPVIKGMKPLAAAEDGGKTTSTYGGTMADTPSPSAGNPGIPPGNDPAALQKKIEELQAQIAAMQKDKSAFADQYADVKKQLDAKNAQADGDKAMSEKKDAFNRMLAEGKVVEAQREPFISGDMIKFSELARKTNSGIGGSGDGGNDLNDADMDAQDKVLALAEKIVIDSKETKKPVIMRDAISQVLRDKKNVKLAEEYNKFRSDQNSYKV